MADGATLTDPVEQLAPVEVLVCTTCRLAAADPAADPGAPRAGAVLAAALAAALDRDLPGRARLSPVECLSNCSRGCTVALRGPGRWTYIYGNLDPDRDLPALVEGAAKFHAAPGGLVPWRERPEHFRRNCIARIPPLEPQA